MNHIFNANIKFLSLIGVFVLGFEPVSPGLSVAQDPTQKAKVEIPAPEDMTLKTRDGVDLRCTYFKAYHQPAPSPATAEAGTEPVDAGKTTLPFILLHDWSGSRNDLYAFGLQLQKAGCAVIIPDLRGHGESLTMAQGMQKIDRSKFKKPDYVKVFHDVEACKKFLVQKNNEGELNIDLLNVVAIGQTSTIALNWVISDWYAFPPYKGKIKQGQDVKSLTLISPTKKLELINPNAELKHPMFSGRNPQIPNLPTLLVWADDGSESSDIKESRSLFETMRKGRPDLSKIADEGERADKETLYDVVIPRSRLIGTELLNQNQGLRSTIMEFVAIKVGSFRDQHPWQDRSAKE